MATKDLGVLTWKKTFFYLSLFLLVFVLPVFLCSNCMMDVYQKKVDKEPETDFNKWLQLTSAGICAKTWRYERAVEMYGIYVDRFPVEDPNFAFALFRRAQMLEDADRYDEAIEEYQHFISIFPEHEDAERAERGIERIKYMLPGAR
ncbi:MAG: tetratricopeptide repeat protein [Planctomycetota bacterium]|jgi:tetratricopeptide (TPR) repeat protein